MRAQGQLYPKTVLQDLAQQYAWVIPAFMGILIMHPMQVVGMQVIWARFNRTAANREFFRNSLSATIAIKRFQGMKGFYRGFVPGLITYAFAYN